MPLQSTMILKLDSEFLLQKVLGAVHILCNFGWGGTAETPKLYYIIYEQPLIIFKTTLLPPWKAKVLVQEKMIRPRAVFMNMVAVFKVL